MRSFMITTVLAALATLAIGSTIPTAANLTNAMKWVGPSKGVNVTLYGRADVSFLPSNLLIMRQDLMCHRKS